MQQVHEIQYNNAANSYCCVFEYSEHSCCGAAGLNLHLSIIKRTKAAAATPAVAAAVVAAAVAPSPPATSLKLQLVSQQCQ
jgi:hypothetical protein